MTDDLRERIADALTYRPASSAYDYADRVLPVVYSAMAEELRRQAHKLWRPMTLDEVKLILRERADAIEGAVK